jgi:hypothetical protein
MSEQDANVRLKTLNDDTVYEAIKGMYAAGLAEAQSRRSKKQIEDGVSYVTQFVRADANLEADFALAPPSWASLSKTADMLETAQKNVDNFKLSEIAPTTFERWKQISKGFQQTALVMLSADANTGALSSQDKEILSKVAQGKYAPAPAFKIPRWGWIVGGSFLAFVIFTQGYRLNRYINLFTRKR